MVLIIQIFSLQQLLGTRLAYDFFLLHHFIEFWTLGLNNKMSASLEDTDILNFNNFKININFCLDRDIIV